FICCGTFRQSLLCHAAAPLDPAPSAARVAALEATAFAHAVAELPELFSNSVEKFKTIEGVGFSTNRPLLKMTLFYLQQAWPEPLTVDALWQAIESRWPPSLRTGEDGGPSA